MERNAMPSSLAAAGLAPSPTGDLLAGLDVFETRLTDDARHVRAYTTAPGRDCRRLAGVIRARSNTLAQGTDTIFAGTPEWDVH